MKKDRSSVREVDKIENSEEMFFFCPQKFHKTIGNKIETRENQFLKQKFMLKFNVDLSMCCVCKCVLCVCVCVVLCCVRESIVLLKIYRVFFLVFHCVTLENFNFLLS